MTNKPLAMCLGSSKQFMLLQGHPDNLQVTLLVMMLAMFNCIGITSVTWFHVCSASSIHGGGVCTSSALRGPSQQAG